MRVLHSPAVGEKVAQGVQVVDEGEFDLLEDEGGLDGFFGDLLRMACGVSGGDGRGLGQA